MTDLRERVVRRMIDAVHDDITGMSLQQYSDAADAAIALIVEECAKVARDVLDRIRAEQLKAEEGSVTFTFYALQALTASEIEAAIRALVKKEGEV